MNKKVEKRKSTDESVDNADETEDLEFSDEEGGLRIDDIYVPPPPKAVCSTEGNGPRLIITKIVNNFFKSYAETEVLGPFHKCFNAIVGPNGSGKSNVIDSMLFVFGYRATKIRSKKLSVLLHNSEHYQNVQSCTVEVHFALIIDKEGDDYEVVPDSVFVVSRTACKDNSSYYQLNGRRVQFKEVALLLRNHGVDLDHNRFLILQGEVEQIAMMKSKASNEHETGLLEYLEDIIGTSRFKKPLMQLQDRLEILSEQRTEKFNRLKLVEKELEELQGPMEEAVGFLKLENSIIRSKNILYQKNIQNLQLKIDETSSQRATIQAKCDELDEKLRDLRQTKAEKETTLKGEARKYENLEKKRDNLKEAFDQANNKDIQLQAEMQQVNKSRKKTKELLAEERKKLEEYKSVPKKSEETIAECEAKEKELSEKKEKLEEEKLVLLSNLRTETQDLQEQKEVLQKELTELNKVVAETKEPYALAESELKIYLSNEEEEKKKLETLKEQYEKAETTFKERTKEVAELKKKIPLTEKSLQEAMDELNGLRNRETTIVNDIRHKRLQVEESKSAMQASRSRGRVLDSLMQQKREGKCPGLFGRLGDLGAIDLKYDVAISTACGPLDNIVVDTVESAQWCIEFLKRHDIGRATFIALDKQEHLRQRADTAIKTPENVPRLFDLVKVQDERVRTAFYYALRDTLVAKDLDQASRIAYGAQRYRVVTLNGDLIETTGTMSGGGKRVSRGRMGQSVAVSNIDPKQIEEMEVELVNQEQELHEIRQRQVAVESQVNTLQPELRQMKVNFEKFSMDLKSLKDQIPLLQQQLKKQESIVKSTKADEAQVKNLTDIINKTRVAYEKAVASADKVQVKVNKLTAEIKEKTTDRVRAMDKKIKDISNQIDKCKNEITRLRVAIKTSERNVKKSTEKIANMEQDIINAENNLRSMKAQRDEIETDAAKLLECMKEIVEKLEEGQEEFAEIKEEVAALTKKESKIRGEKIEVEQKLKAFDKVIQDCKAEIHSWRAKLAQLKLQEVPNESVEPLKELSTEELDAIDTESVKRELHVNEDELKALKPNLNAIQEYCKKRAVFIERANELEAISQKKAQIRDVLDTVRTKRKEEFVVGYNIIRLKLKEMYQMITLGGDADFEMVDTFDPFTEGIQFNVRPPKKSWKMISNLSGGEKTLSSLALVFALHYYKPSPLYVMDEIDAALDFKNVSIIGNYIKERTKNAQFIIISLRPNMFELSDYLIGIYKTFDSTKSLTIDPRVYSKKETQSQKSKSETQTAETQKNKTQAAETEKNDESQNAGTGNSPTNSIQNVVVEMERDRSRTDSSVTTDIETSSQSTVNKEVISDSFEEMEVDC